MDLRTWFASLPKFRRGAFFVFATVATLTLLVADQPIAHTLLLRPAEVWERLALWQPFTALLLYPDHQAGLLFGTLLIQWFAGSELEGFWGTRKYLALIVGSALAGHLAQLLLAWVVPSAAVLAIGGATGMDLAALTAFGVVFGARSLHLLPLTVRTFAAIMVVLTLVSPLLRGAPWPTVVPWIVAVGIALLATTQPWRRGGSSGKVRGARKRNRKHLRVVKPDPRLLN